LAISFGNAPNFADFLPSFAGYDLQLMTSEIKARAHPEKSPRMVRLPPKCPSSAGFSLQIAYIPGFQYSSFSVQGYIFCPNNQRQKNMETPHDANRAFLARSPKAPHWEPERFFASFDWLSAVAFELW
jgi:hypothetical protein